MFRQLATLPGLRTPKSEHAAIEGLFDGISKLWGRPEKKGDVESWKHFMKGHRELCAIIMRTYGSSDWISKTGLVKTATVSGNGISQYLEVGGRIPQPLEPAIDHHLSVVKQVADKWKAVIAKHTQTLRAALTAVEHLATNAEKAARLQELLKNVQPPDLLKDVSLVGLMGHVKKDVNGSLSIGGEDTGATVPPLTREQLLHTAALTCRVLTATDGFYKAYNVPIIFDDEDDEDFIDQFEHNKHLTRLFSSEAQSYTHLKSYYELIGSGTTIAHALERWMHRSVK